MDQRILEAEWLDHLPAGDPRAVRSRRDLRIVNRIMGHAGMIRRALRQHPSAEPRRIVEIGAGDGTLLLRALHGSGPCEVVLVDRQPVVDENTRERYGAHGWDLSIETADVFEWLERPDAPCDAVVANLFLHHFDDSALARMLAALAGRTTLFVACEPLRARMPLAGSRMLGLIGCNDVSRHDAVVSVRAGFRGRELSHLWPDAGRWTLTERSAGFLSHYFLARSTGGGMSRP